MRREVSTVTIVGAGLAGLRAAETLRREGFAGRIVMIGAEPHLPYDRPPLSKELLAGEWEPEQVALRREPYDQLDLDLRLGVRATGLDLDARTLDLAGGERLGFDGLVVATGATPRVLPDLPALDGIFTLRTLDDCLALRGRLDAGARVAVIGAGFIGAEVAATCRKRGLSVTVLEALPQPMVRGVGEQLGAVLARMHREEGVDLRCGVQVEAIEGKAAVERVRLADGTVIETDALLVAIGVAPETRWLEGSGLVLDDGVVCDRTLLAAPGVVAAGDLCRWPNPLFDGELMRLEHWTNAAESGVAAARRLLAELDGGTESASEPFAPVPFVWSDQYDVKIQVVGRIGADADVAIVHGGLDGRQFVALFGRDGRLTGALAFTRPRQLMHYRRMIAERATFAEALEHAHAVDGSIE